MIQPVCEWTLAAEKMAARLRAAGSPESEFSYFAASSMAFTRGCGW